MEDLKGILKKLRNYTEEEELRWAVHYAEHETDSKICITEDTISIEEYDSSLTRIYSNNRINLSGLNTNYRRFFVRRVHLLDKIADILKITGLKTDFEVSDEDLKLYFHKNANVNAFFPYTVHLDNFAILREATLLIAKHMYLKGNTTQIPDLYQPIRTFL